MVSEKTTKKNLQKSPKKAAPAPKKASVSSPAAAESMTTVNIPSLGMRSTPFKVEVRTKDLPMWAGISVVTILALSSQQVLIWNEEVIVLLCFLAFVRGLSQYGGSMIADFFNTKIDGIKEGLGGQTKAEMQDLRALQAELNTVIAETAHLPDHSLQKDFFYATLLHQEHAKLVLLKKFKNQARCTSFLGAQHLLGGRRGNQSKIWQTSAPIVGPLMTRFAIAHIVSKVAHAK
jgi:hypothetical protein